MVFLPGFKSDMDGTKAAALDAWARRRGQACLRFDYGGHGRSTGRFEDGTISSWTRDALAVIDAASTGPLVLVGSSMGAWIMTLVAHARGDRIAGLVGIAAAPDFTDELLSTGLDADRQATLQAQGYVDLPSDYDDEPLRVTRTLIEDGAANRVLDRSLAFDGPVRLIHAVDDPDVPWTRSQRLAEAIAGDDVHLTLLKSGGHRLSRPQDLTLLSGTVRTLCDRYGSI